ncbi:Signal transduction histidine kinase CheA [Nitrincola lacisaponensis]|uniref:Chemotaxis protein CheA n=1 Tax=Nitrincola lacisaponensis TaxID=267850 RepID=A0A063Y358_9GAMM|nr:chemotaxis protein CheA [Nitrincola lacisaponensis]KDE39585.1 Signal transduction histidine kinase CheA [Nitrincola lacisaponensis]
MSLDVDQEILEDFLVEAGEILELLSEQLVELEQRPEDRDLLNAIFRGFHTVKGGAGFLQLEAMVDCCHKAENLFDLLRNGELAVSPLLMDVVLQALDSVNLMFEQVRSGREPEPAPVALLERLDAYTTGNVPDEVEIPAVKPSVSPAPANPNTSNDEFDQLLGDLVAGDSEPKPAATASSASDDLITEDEFDALLDELHGAGKGPGASAGVESSGVKASSDEITEDEFEALLDELQAKGQGAFAAATTPGAVSQPIAPVAAPPQAVAAPAGSDSSSVDTAARNAAPAQAQQKAVQESNVRVDTALLDKIMNMVGELVLVRNRLVRLGGTREDEEMSKALGTLDMVTADLQTSVMKTRMQPVKKVFGRFPRLIRDLSRSLKKEIRLELRGEETDLDKNLVEALADPLIHLVRNAVDHGIEAPDVREKMGKPREGSVLLSAEQEGDHILLIIRDDGAGMDPEKLRRLAVERGMLDTESAARLTDQECFNLIFHAGFSTKTEISDVSGRGVGMDVVKTKITQLNGTLGIDSILGQGTQIAIQVPLTLAIMPTLMVTLEGQAFALPLVNVNEIYNLDLTKTNIVDGQQVIIVRDQALPLFHLKRWMVKGCEHEPLPDQGHVVIVSVGTTRVGFVVDQLVGQEEVVIKPLGSILHGTQGLSGATITGDGRIALIIDIPNLLKRYAS